MQVAAKLNQQPEGYRCEKQQLKPRFQIMKKAVRGYLSSMAAISNASLPCRDAGYGKNFVKTI